ncbi:MAG: hypothetical protein A2052_03105 [Deltaproteobacteria bacterium GWA2_54_12]|nr:MAG: hypothetical protein A2052_03105 [Deltaproteobacteria bacterium GWA2_54_12]
MNLRKLKNEFREGRISKPEYIDRMHEHHRLLFEYAKFIKGTDIKKIEITDDFVIMTSRETDTRIVCDCQDKRIAPIEILNFDDYEKKDFDMILSLVHDGDRVFDIGGNIGWYSINIARAKPNTNVLVFEPIPKTYGYLARNIELNDVKNVEAFNFGFSDVEKEIPFFYYPEGSGNASLANLFGSDSVVQVQACVKCLDAFVKENPPGVDFIKCDVEGAELFVFRGGINAIRKHKPVIFSELLRKWAGKFNYHPNEVIRLLAGEGYRCFTVRGKGLVEFFQMDESSVETNFFFLHGEKHRDRIDFMVCPSE